MTQDRNRLSDVSPDEADLVEDFFENGDPDEREAEFAAAIQSLSDLRHAHDSRMSVQKVRIGFGNRISAMQRQVDDNLKPVPKVYQIVFDSLVSLENDINKIVEAELKTNRVYTEWLCHIKGVGPMLAGQLLAMLKPPLADAGPSTWYKAAGLAPELRPDGTMRLPRPRKGEGRITYYKPLRVCLYNIATSLVRTNGYYRGVYERERARLDILHKDDELWPKGRLFSTARWAMIRLFLAHLYERWSEIEEINTARRAYVIDRLGHHFIPAPLPEDYEGKI